MALFGLFGNSETIYFPGCYTWEFVPKKIENYRKILKKLDIDFKLHKNSEFICCGGFLGEAGYEKDLRTNAKNNQLLIDNKKYKKIITSCPLCYNTFRSYKEILPNWNIEIEFIISSILNKLQEAKSPVKNYFSEPVAYYDSCYLGRYAEFIEPPRSLLKLLGFSVIELPNNKEETLCCGSCGNLPAANKELSDNIAKKFIESLIKRKISKIVTADPQAYYHLKKNSIAMQIDEKTLEILEFSDLLCDALGIKRGD